MRLLARVVPLLALVAYLSAEETSLEEKLKELNLNSFANKISGMLSEIKKLGKII